MTKSTRLANDPLLVATASLPSFRLLLWLHIKYEQTTAFPDEAELGFTHTEQFASLHAVHPGLN